MASKRNGKAGIYVHIPFCVRKCNYCAFLSFPACEEEREEYVEALIKEIELWAEKCKGKLFDTVYFGGGTPSLLSPEQIDRILRALRAGFDIEEDAEITLEANPGTLSGSYMDALPMGNPEGEPLENAEIARTNTTDSNTITRLKAYRKSGINRLSMGVQSMNDERLKFLGRIHDVETVWRDYRIAREIGFDNINLDIIFSIPKETCGEALEDISQIAALGPEHISFYSLQLEEGTPFFELWEQRELEEVDDETDRETFHRGCRLLEKLGYEHYEISNFARPGYESRHNSKYWNMSDYLGLGLGASGMLDGKRYKNLSELSEYKAEIAAGMLPIEEEHINSQHDNISEAVFTGLRRRAGIRFADIMQGEADPGAAFKQYYEDSWHEVEGFVNSGHLIIDDNGMRLTEEGIDISNKIMSLFV